MYLIEQAMECNGNENEFKTPLRGDDVDVRGGARQTDQLERLKQNAEEQGAQNGGNRPDPSVVHVNNGEPDDTQSERDDLKARGSGYTYDEDTVPSNESTPLENEEDEIVKLPDLGKPNRP